MTPGVHRGRLQTPGPAIMGTVSRESDDASPEPSPEGPPPPHPQPQNLTSYGNNQSSAALLPPWTPHVMNNAGHHNYPAFDEESLPSVPDAPSPYSPPPASLFSGEEFPPKSTRKPVPEAVRIPRSGGVLTDLSLNHAMENQQRYISSPQESISFNNMDRPQLLPTVLYLKKDLQESHQSLFLLQQENKALSAECERFQQELIKWQAAAKSATLDKENALQQQIQQLQDRNSTLLQNKEQCQVGQREAEELLATHKEEAKNQIEQSKRETRECKHEAEKLSNELLAAKATIVRLETSQSHSHNEIEGLQTEIRNVRAKMKEQSQSSTKKVQQMNHEHEQIVVNLQNEQKSNLLEIDRLKAMLNEANRSLSNQLAEVEANAQADLIHFQTAADEANARLEELRSEWNSRECEFTKNECTLQDTIDQLRAELIKRNSNDEQLQKVQKESQNKVKGIEEALADATERENELLIEKEELQRNLENKIDEMQQQVNNLEQAIAKADAEKNALQKSLSQKNDALKESYAKYKSLRADKDKLQKEVTQLQKLSSSNGNNRRVSKSLESESALQDEVDRLQENLSKANAKCSELRTERSSLAKELANMKYARTEEHKIGIPQHSVVADDDINIGQPGDDLIPDRLGRIRDATERALLVKEYRRELNRLKSEHEAEIKRLTVRHDQDLKDVFEEAKSEMSARSRESRRRLQNEYEVKISALERRYQTELARAQRECDKNTAVAEEAVEAAAVEVAAITDQLDKEINVRETLETTVRELEHKLVVESQKSKLSVEWMKSRKQWQKETNHLLRSIQEECNAAFAHNLVPLSITPNKENGKKPFVESSTSSVASISASMMDTSVLSNIENVDPTTGSTTPLPTPWDNNHHHKGGGNNGNGLGGIRSSYNSPLDVTQAVDETEALVRSLLGN